MPKQWVIPELNYVKLKVFWILHTSPHEIPGIWEKLFLSKGHEPKWDPRRLVKKQGFCDLNQRCHNFSKYSETKQWLCPSVVKGLAYMTLGLSNWDPREMIISVVRKEKGRVLRFYDLNSLIRSLLLLSKVGTGIGKEKRPHLSAFSSLSWNSSA